MFLPLFPVHLDQNRNQLSYFRNRNCMRTLYRKDHDRFPLCNQLSQLHNFPLRSSIGRYPHLADHFRKWTGHNRGILPLIKFNSFLTSLILKNKIFSPWKPVLHLFWAQAHVSDDDEVVHPPNPKAKSSSFNSSIKYESHPLLKDWRPVCLILQ